MAWIPILFWSSAAWLGYTYAGYPALIAAAARIRPRPWRKVGILPDVSLIVAAWNEEAVIAEKIENALAADYPQDRLEILIASDGSSDATVAIARRYQDRGVRVLDLPRGGKTATLNRAVAEARGEILVFSDANVFLAPNALKRLVRHFADPSIGGVTGDVRLKPEGFTLGQSQGLYYRYERFIQEAESEVGSTIGADGGMYAIRRTCFQPVPEEVINDDFVISMNVIAQNRRLVYDPSAIAYEDSPPNAGLEFDRKTRVEHGNFQSLFGGHGRPGLRHPWTLFAYLSHKASRWLAFVPLSLAMTTSIALARTGPLHATALGLQSLFYFLALLGWRLEGKGGPILSVPFYFVLENLAAARGLVRAVTGKRAWGSTRVRVKDA